jgi:PadR family transcriptional regulator PadR
VSDPKRDLPKNDIPLLILAVLADGARHGYAIAREIERVSAEALRLREGSLYPALRVLEQDGFIRGEWQIPPAGPARKVYSLTEAGRAELAKRSEAWRRYAEFVGLILSGGATPSERPA